jgi:type VI secretion system protein ImpK
MSDEPGNPKPPTERTIIRPGRAAGASPSPGGGFPPPPASSSGGNSERTMISPGRAPAGFPPMPGQVGGQGYAPSPAQASAASGGSARIDFADAEPDLYGPEPLVAAAGRLIHLASRLRVMPVGPDLPQLRQLVIRELDAFRPRAQQLGLDAKTTQLAHYILCAFMDDAVMSTPWGANSPWSQHSLLAAYHNDVQGGERLFEFAERMEQDPKREPRLMELLYQCLSLGFEGRMAVDPRGASLLQQRRSRLAAAIGGIHPAPSAELSPQWRGTTSAAGAYEPKVPLWAVLAGLGLIALVIFSALLFRLSSQTSAAIASLNQAVGTSQIVPPPPTPQSKTATFDQMSSILAPDVASGRLKVLREGNEIVLRLVNQGLFESAQAEPASAWSDTFGRLAQAANLTKGPLRVEGHTDNQQIRSLQYPSNLDLSVARAQAVGAKLGGAGMAYTSRIKASGLGDAQPVGDNSTADGRRENRRVEIRVANDVAWQ